MDKVVVQSEDLKAKIRRFSVIIPLFNKGLYIERALRSVLNQSRADYEIVVVDDRSEDDGLARARKVLCDSGVAFRLIARSRRGGSCAPPRATGLRFSRGRYVAFLDADDEWYEGFLAEVDELIQKFPNAEAYGVDRVLEAGGNMHPSAYARKSGRDYLHTLDLEKYLDARARFGNPFRVQGMVFLPQALDDIGGFRHAPRSSDIDLMFRFFLSGKTAAWSPRQALLIHRVPQSTIEGTPFQITRPWFYSIQEAIDRGITDDRLKPMLMREIKNKKVMDITAATSMRALDSRFLNSIRFCESPALWLTILILSKCPWLQRSLVAKKIRKLWYR